MRLREWDPRTAAEADIESVLHTLNLTLAEDLPEDPQWRIDALREYLAVTMPGERRLCWRAEDDAGEVLGHASVLLLGDIGVVDVLVRPRFRRRGVGRALLVTAARRAHEEGFTALGAEAVGGTPAVPFYEAHRFDCAYVEIRSVLRLDAVDWPQVEELSRTVANGYRIEYNRGGPPEHMFASYAAAKARVREAATVTDLELSPRSYDPERLRASLDTLHARGMTPHIVVAVHERSETVVGLSEVVVPAQHPTRADQYDTVVVPAHRGYGLTRAMKARMLLALRAAEPQLRDVQTWNAQQNAPMIKVNADLGFQPDREWREYEVDTVDLVRAQPA